MYGPNARRKRDGQNRVCGLALISGLKKLFDRGYPSAVRPIHGEMTGGVSQQLADLFAGNQEKHAWCRDSASGCIAASERRGRRLWAAPAAGRIIFAVERLSSSADLNARVHTPL